MIFDRKDDVVAALLPSTVAQGFSPEVARAGLEAEVASWSQQELAALSAGLASDLRPRVVLVIAARTLPASALRQCLLARHLGARVLLKCAAGQEALAEALATLDPGIVPRPFASDDPEAVAAAIAEADTIVVLGSDETVAAVRASTPVDKTFAAHGHKVSAAWLGPDPDLATLEGLAADLLAWDQAGCLAPQVIWSEGDPITLGQRLVPIIAQLEATLPLADATAHRQARARLVPLVTMLGGQILGTPTTALATLSDAAFRPSPGPRIAWVLPADTHALDALSGQSNRPAILSTLGTDTSLRLPPPVRVCPPGGMQRPPLSWSQDGLHPVNSLLVRRA